MARHGHFDRQSVPPGFGEECKITARSLRRANLPDNLFNFRQRVVVEFLQSRAEGVGEARFAVRRADKTILRTFAPAILEIGTFAAIARFRNLVNSDHFRAFEMQIQLGEKLPDVRLQSMTG